MLAVVIVLGIVVVIFIAIIATMAGKIKNANQNISEEIKEDDTNESAVNYPYHSKYLLTTNEYKFYKSLKPIADKYNLQILPKVRIWDIIEVNNGLSKSEKTSAQNRIKSKHFDFVLADNNLYIKCIIELDDNFHNNTKAKEKDEFKNELCETVNLPIIRCYDINGVEEQICSKLNYTKI